VLRGSVRDCWQCIGHSKNKIQPLFLPHGKPLCSIFLAFRNKLPVLLYCLLMPVLDKASINFVFANMAKIPCVDTLDPSRERKHQHCLTDPRVIRFPRLKGSGNRFACICQKELGCYFQAIVWAGRVAAMLSFRFSIVKWSLLSSHNYHLVTVFRKSGRHSSQSSFTGRGRCHNTFAFLSDIFKGHEDVIYHLAKRFPISISFAVNLYPSTVSGDT